MREQLIQYVKLLFAGTPDSEDMQQEILQNTLDRYDDLVAQGKSPEAAYRLAISGIGDINEILGGTSPAPVLQTPPVQQEKTINWRKPVQAFAVFLCIISVIPLIALSTVDMEILGLCAMLAIVAVAVVALILADDKKEEKKQAETTPRQKPQHPAYKIYDSLSTVVMFVVYFAVSFWSGAWHITWLVFPIFACFDGIVKALFDLKEANKHEN